MKYRIFALLLPFRQTRSETDGDAFRIEIPGINADRPVFIVFDSTGAHDETFGDCESGCLVTSDFSPLEPDAVEHKYYIPGIGLILETKLRRETG